MSGHYPPGNVRGSLIEGWSENVARRWGRDGLQRIRDSIESRGVRPNALIDPKRWYPAALQLAITEAMLEQLQGDWDALAQALESDVRYRLGTAKTRIAKLVGPTKLVTGAPKIHPESYDVGAVSCTRTGKAAELRYTGASLVEHPTWQQLQVVGWQTIFSICERPLTQSHRAEAEGFIVTLRW